MEKLAQRKRKHCLCLCIAQSAPHGLPLPHRQFWDATSYLWPVVAVWHAKHHSVWLQLCPTNFWVTDTWIQMQTQTLFVFVHCAECPTWLAFAPQAILGCIQLSLAYCSCVAHQVLQRMIATLACQLLLTVLLSPLTWTVASKQVAGAGGSVRQAICLHPQWHRGVYLYYNESTMLYLDLPVITTLYLDLIC